MRYLALVVLVLVMGCGEQRTYRVHKDLSYDQASTPYGVFDLYVPKNGNTQAPALVYIHGGAFQGGDKQDAHELAQEICRRGITLLAINYRLTMDTIAPGGSLVLAAPWPAQINDVHAALRYARGAGSSIGIDPTRIGTIGISAGGHLAAMAHLREDPKDPGKRPVCAVAISGEHDLRLPPAKVMTDFDGIVSKLLGKPGPWNEAELGEISPAAFARRDATVLVIHSVNDHNVFIHQGEIMFKTLRNVGADVTNVEVPGDMHQNAWHHHFGRGEMGVFLSSKLGR